MKILKISVLLVLAGVWAPGGVYAQWFRSGAKALRTPRASIQAPAVMRKLPPLSGRLGTFSVPSAALERYVFQTVAPSAATKLAFMREEPSYAWMTDMTKKYNRLAQHFEVFKKEADAFLFYQANVSERRTLHPAEIARWQAKIDDMAEELAVICQNIDPDDPFLTFADEYITYARWAVNPHAKDIYFITPLPPRQDRVFVQDEFFLHSPEEKSHRWELASSRAKRISAQLPLGLRVAVVNDFRIFRLRVEELHRKGWLFAEGSLKTYDGADDLLKDILQKGKKYDVILTDIIISGGAGGYYLTSELRQHGYDGVIIALSSYTESEELGQKMFERGLDGMIPLQGGDEYSRSWPADVMQKLLNHYHYRDLHGWNR